MTGVSTDFKRNLLRGIAWDATENSLTLEAALKAACRARYTDTADGLTLVGSAGNGQSVTFSLPSAASNYAPALISAAVSQLYDLYAEACEELTTDAVDSVTDELRLACMLALLKPRTSTGVDYSLMREVA